MKKLLFFLTGFVLLSSFLLMKTISADNDNNVQVTICHANNDVNNPYVAQSPNIKNDGSLDGGHLNHTGPLATSLSLAQSFKTANTKWGDIIPPYTSGNFVFAGLNWTTIGQAMLHNNCGFVTPVCTDPNAINYVAKPTAAQYSDNTTCTYTPAGTCPAACGQPASQVPDGKGGFTKCSATPACVTDVCPNIDGVQTQVPDDYVTNVDGQCVKQDPCAHQDNDEDEDQDDSVCITPTVTPSVTPTVTPSITPTPTTTSGGTSGGGDGLSDGLGCATHDCSQHQSSGGSVLGASTGPEQAVLGASTMAGTGTFAENLMNIMFVAGTIILGAGIKSYAKEKKN